MKLYFTSTLIALLWTAHPLAEDHSEVNKAMLEKLSAQKTQSEIIREALTFQYGRVDIQTFSLRAENVYSKAKVAESVKFDLLLDSLKSDQMFS